MTSAAASDEQVNEYYRRSVEGHIYIRETLEAVFERVAERVRQLGRAPRVLELGSHAGILTEKLLQRCPELDLHVHDDDRQLVSLARRRLAGSRVTFHEGPLDELAGSVDLVISVARHHHLPHDYLGHVRRVMKPAASYVLGDELCPEYCEGEQLERIARAEVIHIAGGYVLTSRADVAAFVADGTLPEAAVELERLRRRALWRWYRFVVDHAVNLGYFDVAAGELRSACDDFVTGSDAEHKFSAAVVERQFELAGFRRLAKELVGPSERERQGMFVYEYGLA